MEKIDLWKDRQQKVVDPALFSVKAERLAKEIAGDHQVRKGKKANKRTQLRRFYDEVLSLDTEAQANPAHWDAILPQLHMLIAKAAYARGRELVSDNFLNFIKDSIGQINSSGDLKVFANFFEAFMGFYRLHGPKN